MATKTTLHDLPPELIQATADFLDIEDIYQLRLTRRELLHVINAGSFRSRFAKKDILMAKSQLELFAAVTQQSSLACNLRHLTLTGIVSDEPQVSNEVALKHLLKAFTNLARYADPGILISLALTVKCHWRENDALVLPGFWVTSHFRHAISEWQKIWQCAGDTATIVAAALQRSSIKLIELDMYHTTGRCALSSGRFGAVSGILPRLKVLKKLSVVLSSDETNHHRASHYSDLGSEVSGLINDLSHLEELNLRWFDVRLTKGHETQLKDCELFDEVARLKIPLLARVSLTGLHTSENSLSTFLRTHRKLTNLTLECIYLEEGSWRPVFDIIEKDLELDSLYLEGLREERLIQFESEGEPHFPQPGGPTWLRMSTGDQRQAIKYRVMRGHILASAQHTNWWRKKQNLYGPA